MSTMHAGYYQRSFADGTTPVLFHISVAGDEWRWDARSLSWVLLDGTTVVERVMDADPWTDKVDRPTGIPAAPSSPN